MRANADDYRRSISLFAQSRKKPSDEMAEVWNIDIDGSIAFLRHDCSAAERARAELAATVRPSGFNLVRRDGRPSTFTWPPNLAVLEALLQCWDVPYARAYSCASSR